MVDGRRRSLGRVTPDVIPLFGTFVEPREPWRAQVPLIKCNVYSPQNSTCA